MNEPLTKRLTRIYFEDGLGEALADAEAKTAGYPAIRFIVQVTRYLFEKSKQLNDLVWPSYQDTNLIEEYSQTRYVRCSLWSDSEFNGDFPIPVVITKTVPSGIWAGIRKSSNWQSPHATTAFEFIQKIRRIRPFCEMVIKNTSPVWRGVRLAPAN